MRIGRAILAGIPACWGKSIRGFGKPLPIVGVLPPGFRFPDKTDLWYPVNTVRREPTADRRGGQNYFAVGRLKPGVSLQRAQTEMATIAWRLAQQYPDPNKDRTVAVTRCRMRWWATFASRSTFCWAR